MVQSDCRWTDRKCSAYCPKLSLNYKIKIFSAQNMLSEQQNVPILAKIMHLSEKKNVEYR